MGIELRTEGDRWSWRMAIEHTTTYSYSNEVRASFNEVRVLPQNDRRQFVLDASVSTEPAASLYRYRDYWGTEVVAFDVAEAHDLLRVRASALVETSSALDPSAGSWDTVVSARSRMFEFCAASIYTAWDDELFGSALRLRGPSPVATVASIAEWVHDTLEYSPGSTGVHTSALEAWRARRGVCQDFTHLTIAMLRSVGIPARYVSGYLHSDHDTGVGVQALGQSHAWPEAWTGEWWGVDPTNATAVGPSHVTVAHGRDYSDVPPVKGIFAGSADDQMTVEVKLTRVA